MLRSICCSCLLVTHVFGYSGGTGTVDDPYQIATADDLITLGNTPSDYTKSFVLTKDIDLTRYTFSEAVIAPDESTWYSGFQGTPFSGYFNGQGYVIRYFSVQASIYDEDYVGLFGCLSHGAEISNLGLEAADVNGTGSYIGALVKPPPL